MKKVIMLLLVLTLAPLAQGFAMEVVPPAPAVTLDDLVAMQAAITQETGHLSVREARTRALIVGGKDAFGKVHRGALPAMEDRLGAKLDSLSAKDGVLAKVVEATNANTIASDNMSSKLDNLSIDLSAGQTEVANLAAEAVAAKTNDRLNHIVDSIWLVVFMVIMSSILIVILLFRNGRNVVSVSQLGAVGRDINNAVREEASTIRSEVLQAVAKVPEATDALVKTLAPVTRPIELSNGSVYEYTVPVVDGEYQSLHALPTTVMPPNLSKTQRYHHRSLSRVMNSTTTVLEGFYVGKKFDGADIQSRVQSNLIRFALDTGELVKIR